MEKKKTFPVRGMTCAACVASVESMLKTAPGGKDAAVNLANQSAQVIYDESENTPEGLRKVVQSIGYDLLIDVDDTEAEQEIGRASCRESLWVVCGDG